MESLKVKFKIVKDSFKFFVAYLISRFIKNNNKYRDILLIGERRKEAKDNGYWLFRYIRENQCEKNAYYVIEKNSKYIKNIEKYKNVIFYGTFKHYIYFILSNKIAGAHQGSCVPDTPICWKWLENGKLSKKRIYLKHGIVKEKIGSLVYENNKFDAIICGAKPEYNFIKAEFGYPDGAVKYTGLCRFDNLHDFKIKKKQILLMPTWRHWFELEDYVKDFEEDRKIFETSEYFFRYSSLLKNKKLEKLLIDNNAEFLFYPHHEIQRFLNLFKIQCENIKIVDELNTDVQLALKEAEILITDYSSVAFDFAYMRKKVLYYQFDYKRYSSQHYSKGYFDYGRDGFGPVIETEENLIEEIKKALEGNVEHKFIDNVNSFFEIYDNKNCERVFNLINSLN